LKQANKLDELLGRRYPITQWLANLSSTEKRLYGLSSEVWSEFRDIEKLLLSNVEFHLYEGDFNADDDADHCLSLLFERNPDLRSKMLAAFARADQLLSRKTLLEIFDA